MNRRMFSVFLAVILLSLIAGCNNSDNEGNTSDYTNVEPENIIETELGTLYVAYKNDELAIKDETGLMEFMIKGVQVADLDVADDHKGLFGKGKEVAIVTLSIESKNNSDDALAFYPNKAALTTDAGDNVEADTFFSDVVGGPYEANVSAAGDVVFIIESKATEVGQLNLTIEGPTNAEDVSQGEPIELTIDLN